VHNTSALRRSRRCIGFRCCTPTKAHYESAQHEKTHQLKEFFAIFVLFFVGFHDGFLQFLLVSWFSVGFLFICCSDLNLV
jgi:hypothetical protein